MLAYRRQWHWTWGLPAALAGSADAEDRSARTVWVWLQLLAARGFSSVFSPFRWLQSDKICVMSQPATPSGVLAVEQDDRDDDGREGLYAETAHPVSMEEGWRRAMRATFLVIAALTALALVPSSASAAVCEDFSNQAATQAAANTIDADGDGIYCESLLCPCSTGSGVPRPLPPVVPPPPPVAPPQPPPVTPAQPPSPPAVSSSSASVNPADCKRPKSVQRLVFSKSKYPNIRSHVLAAIAKGWPRNMVVNRKGKEKRCARLLAFFATKPGFDRDEYPAAVGRGRANGASQGLVQGIDPIGWMADVAYVPSSENRSHGSVLGAKLRRLCNGTCIRYVFS